MWLLQGVLELKIRRLKIIIFEDKLFHGSTALLDLGFFVVEVSRSHSIRHTTLGRTPLDDGSARRRDLFLTTHNTHNRETYMPLAGFEPAVAASERPQTHSLNIAAIGIGHADKLLQSIYLNLNINQLDALNFMSLFHACTCFEHKVSSSGGQNFTIQSLVSSHL